MIRFSGRIGNKNADFIDMLVNHKKCQPSQTIITTSINHIQNLNYDILLLILQIEEKTEVIFVS